MDLSSISQNELKNVSSEQLETLSSLWKDKTCVIIFFRRWGCVFCRLWAKEISAIAPVLKENNVRLIGVGVEELGVEDFVAGNFFDGELYVDVEKKTYKALSFKRFGFIGIVTSLFTSESRSAISRGREMKLGGDLKGDKVQVGGALVVSAGGKEILLNFKQDRPAEHLPNIKFLEALGLQHLALKEEAIKEPEKCNEECPLPPVSETKVEA